MSSSYLRFENVAKIYPTPKGPFVVLDEFNLDIEKGEFVSIIGHSGCGKSTALTMAAGLNSISKGNISLAGRQITNAGPDRAVVFQSPSLFPWMTALENVLLGVKQVFPHGTRKQQKDICMYYLSRLGLGDSMNKKACELSNGMKQRVGIARAFALKPKLLLLDEPFGMLDSLTRTELQEILLEVWHREKITAIMVTHDVDEAVFLSDRVVMMTGGPYARVGKILNIDFPRPRIRKELIDLPDYYEKRGCLIDFLEGHESMPHKTNASEASSERNQKFKKNKSSNDNRFQQRSQKRTDVPNTVESLC